jgi:hypothetical protein
MRLSCLEVPNSVSGPVIGCLQSKEMFIYIISTAVQEHAEPWKPVCYTELLITQSVR